MGYRNNQTGYPKGHLKSRSIIKKDEYALLDVDGLVNNVVPGFTGCDMSILGSPKMGASFVDYIITVNPKGGNTQGFGGQGVESILYVLSGELEVTLAGEKHTLSQGSYAFAGPSYSLCFENKTANSAEVFLYKRRYKPLEGYSEPKNIVSNVSKLEPIAYEGMENVTFYNFLPTNDFSYDMNFHILSFGPGGSHGYVETHVQEHGAYVYSGAGMYNLGNEWVPVIKGDYMFMAAYVQQAAYSTSIDEPFSYVYSKDCNRDESI